MERLKPIFGFPGGKYNQRNDILGYFPENYNVYVEPFVGAGSLFFALEKEDLDKIVLNDKNKDLINFYKSLKKRDSFRCDLSPSKSRIDRLKNRGIENPFCDFLYLQKKSFGGQGQGSITINTAKDESNRGNGKEFKEKLTHRIQSDC